MNICLFGGTFDPPHNGHLAIARQCLSRFQIERVLFVPSYIAPHKTSRTVSPVHHRLTMLRLALQSHPNFAVSEVEIKRGGVSYSIETILQIKKIYRLTQKNLFFLIGSDSLTEFHAWHEPERILAEARVVVATRPHYPVEGIPAEFRDRVELLANPLYDISSSVIRQKVGNGESIEGLVPENVADYIHRHGLYK